MMVFFITAHNFQIFSQQQHSKVVYNMPIIMKLMGDIPDGDARQGISLDSRTF